MSFKTEHRIGVPAPSTVIWDVLSDLERWGEWNPTHPKITGLLRIGQKLEVHETFGDTPLKVIRPTVVDWVPNAQILWTLSEASGLIRRIRYIEIEQFNDEDTACILSNGEIWQGLAGARVGKSIRWRLRAGFEAFNVAAAERVAQVMAGRAQASGDRG
jgi:hypothetical protein